MKITLISPYSNIHSYGIRSISTYLRDNGVTVSTIYLLSSFDSPYNKKIFNQLAKLCFDSDLIGISVMSNYFMNSVQVTKEIKKRLSTPIVWGGVHPTLSPEECLKYCDVVVIGEGEETLLEIINNIENNKSIHTTPGTFVKQNGKIYKSALRDPIQAEDLIIPNHDYSSDYILLKNRLHKINYRILKSYMSSDYMTISSFGCPFSCSYCINNKLKKFYGDKVRFRRVDDVISELVSVKKGMPFIGHVSFDDDAFILRDLEELRDFAEIYKEKVNLPFFVSGINPLTISEEKMNLLVSAGMDRVRMGIQSGSKKSKSIYNRHIPNNKIITAAKIINRYKHKLMLTAFDLILDNQFESKEDVIETIRLLSKLPAPFTLNLFSLNFYPGTDIYREAKSAGFIKDNIKDIYQKHYHDIDNNYLNFVIVLYTIHKIPNWILNLLLKEGIVKKNMRIPLILFKFFQLLGHSRRGINFLVNGDTHTLLRILKTRIIKI